MEIIVEHSCLPSQAGNITTLFDEAHQGKAEDQVEDVEDSNGLLNEGDSEEGLGLGSGLGGREGPMGGCIVGTSVLPASGAAEVYSVLFERDLRRSPIKRVARWVAQRRRGRSEPPPAETAPSTHRRRCQRACLLKLLDRRVPIFFWARHVRPGSFFVDVLAGVTVGVMAIPQSMSYAALAGLPYISGLYSASVPAFCYAIFGQSRQLAVGPVAMVSLLIASGLEGKLSQEECPAAYAPGNVASQAELCPDQYLALATFTAWVSGLIYVISSVLRLGFLVSFLGHPVISGFTTASAITIGLSQMKDILGYPIPKSDVFYETLYYLFRDIAKINWMTFGLSLTILAFLIFNRFLSRRFRWWRIGGAFGPLAVCILGITLMACIPALSERFGVAYVGAIPSGIFPFSPPSWPWSRFTQTLTTALSCFLIGYLEAIAIAKRLAAKHEYPLDPGQEMFALGISNVVGAMFSCFSVTGSFSRSAVNDATGAVSQLSGLVTSIIMFCTFMWLTRLFYYLPKFVPACIVIVSVYSLFAFREVVHLWRVRKVDSLWWAAAFWGTLLLGAMWGILIAVGVSILTVLCESARPQLSILWRVPGTNSYRSIKQENNGAFVPNVFICRIGSHLYFANAAFVKNALRTYVNDLYEVNRTEYLVLEMTPVTTIDTTACGALRDIVAEFRKIDIQVAFVTVGNRVSRTMEKAQLLGFIGASWIFPTVCEAVEYCLLHQRLKARGPIAPETAVSFDELCSRSNNFLLLNETKAVSCPHRRWTLILLTQPGSDVSWLMYRLTSFFEENHLTMVCAQVVQVPGVGWKHYYSAEDVLATGQPTGERARELEHCLCGLLAKLRTDAFVSLPGSVPSTISPVLSAEVIGHELGSRTPPADDVARHKSDETLTSL